MCPDVEKYRPYLERFDLTKAQQEAFIHTLWHFLESFVDRTLGLDPVQQLQPRQLGGDSIRRVDAVESGADTVSGKFEQSAGSSGGGKRHDNEQE